MLSVFPYMSGPCRDPIAPKVSPTLLLLIHCLPAPASSETVVQLSIPSLHTAAAAQMFSTISYITDLSGVDDTRDLSSHCTYCSAQHDATQQSGAEHNWWRPARKRNRQDHDRDAISCTSFSAGMPMVEELAL